MSYRRMNERDLWEIYRRWRGGQSVARIAANERRDRKTVRTYLRRFVELGLQRGGTAVERQRFFRMVEPLLAGRNERPARAREQLLVHRDELWDLINRKKEPLKPKTAFRVVKTKHELDISYATFKRVARAEGLSRPERRRTIRIELPPGLETQLDYGRMGTLHDHRRGANRVVWAFCGILAHSRFPFVDFVWTQDQQEFVGSFSSMWHDYGGTTEFVSIDNLKAGVIKPDLWDPQLNRAFAEAAEHYGVFIDPCRVGRSTDKGKIERLIPVVRELFRMLTELHPDADLAELNRHARIWCRSVYGAAEHGTTGIPPLDAFAQERASLKPLPAERFAAPLWKRVSVHPGDQFLVFDSKRFSLPAAYRGRKVWARYAAPLLQLFDDRHQLVRQYVIEPGTRMYWVPEDFPPEVRQMMNGGYPAWILEQGRIYGQAAVTLLASVLKPHAYLNARRARGMLTVMAVHAGQSYFDEVCIRATRRSVVLPATLKRMLEAAERRPIFQEQLPLSHDGAQMVRDIRYYLN